MEDQKLASSDTNIEVKNSELLQVGEGLRSKRSFAKGEEIFKVKGQKINFRTLRTLQLDETTHIDPVDELGQPELGYYLNHSCNPNAYSLVVEDADNGAVLIIYALQQINEGDELTVDYAFMESEVANGCVCKCGAENCRGRIVGFKDLNDDEIENHLQNLQLSRHLSTLRYKAAITIA